MTTFDQPLGPTWLRELLSVLRTAPSCYTGGDSSATSLQTFLFGYCACLVYHGEGHETDMALLDAFEVWLKAKYGETRNAGWCNVIEAYATAAATGVPPSWKRCPPPTADSARFFFNELDEFLASRGDALPERRDLMVRFVAPRDDE
jgi:hypothetical protein